MNIVPFPLCCGAYILTDFGNTGVTAGMSDPIEPSVVLKFLQDKIRDFGHVAFLIAILNEHQDAVLSETFSKAGFTKAASGKNSGHYGECHTYIYSNHIDLDEGDCEEDEEEDEEEDSCRLRRGREY